MIKKNIEYAAVLSILLIFCNYLSAQIRVNTEKNVLIKDTHRLQRLPWCFKCWPNCPRKKYLVVNYTKKNNYLDTAANRTILNILDHSGAFAAESNTAIQNLIESDTRSNTNGVVNRFKEYFNAADSDTLEVVGKQIEWIGFIMISQALKTTYKINPLVKFEVYTIILIKPQSMPLRNNYMVFNQFYLRNDSVAYGIYNDFVIPDSGFISR
ncbi:MAG: hypothetical protein R2784_20755 [Saprospiraceae bacterium]